MSPKIVRVVALLLLGVAVFKVLMNQSSASEIETAAAIPKEIPAGEVNEGREEVPNTRIIYVTATPSPDIDFNPTSSPPTYFNKQDRLEVIERSPGSQKAADLQPTFRLVFNRLINGMDIDQYLSSEPATELSTRWEEGNVLLIRPSVPLAGGVVYRFTIDKDLLGVDGSSLEYNYSWTYEPVKLVELYYNETLVDGREVVNLMFNYPIDPDSLDWHIIPDISGDLVWSSDNQTLIFTSHSQLLSGDQFSINLGSGLRQPSGEPIPEAETIEFKTEDLGSQKEPPPGSSNNNPYLTLEIPFRKAVNKQRVEEGLIISPAALVQPEYRWQGLTLLAEVMLSPETYYTIEIPEDSLVDMEGNPVSRLPVKWGFRTKKIERIAGFGNGPKLQVLQPQSETGNGIIDYAFFHDQPPVPVTFEIYELTLEAWQSSPAMQDNQNDRLSPLFTWEEPAPIFDEEQYFYTHQTRIPKEIEPGIYRLSMKSFGQPQDTMAIIISEIGLAIRMENDNLLAWVVDLESLEPISADVTIFEGSKAVKSGHSDMNGFVSFSLADLGLAQDEGPLFTVKAQFEDQFTIVGINYSWLSFSSYQEGSPDYQIHPSLDKPVYFPGEVVHLRAVLRGVSEGRSVPVPPGQNLTAVIKGMDSNYEQVESAVVALTTGDYGVGYGDLKIPDNFEPGQYFTFVSYRNVVNSVPFEIVTQPGTYAPIVNVTAPSIIGNGQMIGVSIEVLDSLRGPLADRLVDVALLESVGSGGCYAVSGRNEWLDSNKLHLNGRTDSNGVLHLNFSAEMGYDTHRPFNDSNTEHSILAVVATVTENEISGTGFGVVEVSNTSERLVWEPFSMIQGAGEPFIVTGRVEDLSGSPVPNRRTIISLNEVGNYGIGNLYDAGAQISGLVSISDNKGEVSGSFKVDEPGYYELRIQSQDNIGNEMVTFRPLYVVGDGVVENVPELELGLSAENYFVGQNGRLVILTNDPGPAWLTMTNKNGSQNEVVQLTESVTVIDMPLSEADSPGLSVQVDLWRTDVSDSFSTSYDYYGATFSRRDANLVSKSIEIPVIDPNKQLEVSVISENEPDANGLIAVTVQVINGRGEPVAAEVALSVANQKLYEQFPDHTQPQYDSFIVWPEIDRILYHSFAPDRDLSYQYFGGGCGCGGGWWSDFRLSPGSIIQPSFWYPSLRTDFMGQVTLLVPFPENSDGWHFSATAITADGQVGEANGQLGNFPE